MKTIWLCILTLCFVTKGFSQKQDYYWVLGQNAALNFNDPNGAVFNRGNFYVICTTNSSLINSDSGTLNIFCHGTIIYNRNGMPMENGDSINPCKYFDQSYPANLSGWEGSVILPYPNHANQYFVIYTNLDTVVQGINIPTKIRYSIADMKYNNGLGKVIEKDKTLNEGLFEWGRINAIQHANGRDWWIIQNGFQDLQHYIYLLDPTGIRLYATQTIGTLYPNAIPLELQTCVNNGGDKIAYLYGTQSQPFNQRVDLYDFDRCSGRYLNHTTTTYIDSFPILGCSFSPNDSLLYLSTWFKLFQRNVNDTTLTLIDKWNSTHDPTPTYFHMHKIAPDNKIYISIWGGVRQIHCITNPNQKGIGCNFIQGYIHTDSSNHFFSPSLPNYPNFRLGVLKGSECDTIREASQEVATDDLFIYPNPSKGIFVISYKLLANAKIQVYDVLGKEILPLNTTYTGMYHATIDVSNLAGGMYFLKVTNTNGIVKTVKFVKQ